MEEGFVNDQYEFSETVRVEDSDGTMVEIRVFARDAAELDDQVQKIKQPGTRIVRDHNGSIVGISVPLGGVPLF